MMQSLKILISCPDKEGIVYEISRFIFEAGGNIIDSQQHSLGLDSRFFMRLEIDTSKLKSSLEDLEKSFLPIAEKFTMNYKFSWTKKRMAILVSKYDHCLLDILQKQRSGDIQVDIPVIISNHPTLEKLARSFGISFKCLPIGEAKAEQEKAMLTVLKPLKVDFIAMARYMQILSGDFIKSYPYRIINVHHSFLPSFKGANPYKQAYDKGVKVIGATAHYATEELDMGPIISQGVSHVNYKHSLEDFKSIGSDIEKIVFAGAIKAHNDDKIIIHENKTIVFN